MPSSIRGSPRRRAEAGTHISRGNWRIGWRKYSRLARVCTHTPEYKRTCFHELKVNDATRRRSGRANARNAAELLGRMGTGFGWLAWRAGSSCRPQKVHRRIRQSIRSGPSRLIFSVKAKHVIFLFMNGGVSHVDTFDPKPSLDKYDGKPMPGGNPKTERKTGNLMRSPFQFRRYGQSGLPVSDVFPTSPSVSMTSA